LGYHPIRFIRQTLATLNYNDEKIFILVFTITFFLGVSGQENPKHFAFAKAYFGIDFNYVPSYGESQYINSLGQIENFGRSLS
jgi:hypothetical protein